MIFTIRELKEATGDFDPTKVVGKGGFGEVYRGKLRHTDVAIKVLNDVSSCFCFH